MSRQLDGPPEVDSSRLADRLELAELRARYNHSYDQGDIDEFVALFAPDAESEMGPGNVVQGVAAIRGAAEEAMRFTAGADDFVRHLSDIGVTAFVDDDHATG